MQRALAHARRKFFQAVELNPVDQTAIAIVAQINELFALDAQAREQGLNQADRQVMRLEKSKPLLEEIKSQIQSSTHERTAKERSGQGLQLYPDALDAAHSFPGTSRAGIE
jgi:transposase